MDIFIKIRKLYRDWNYRIKLNNYYQGDKSTPVLAKLINLLFTNLVIFILSYLWFVQRTKKPLIALILSLVITSLLGAAIYIRKRKWMLKRKNIKRKAVAMDFLLDRLKQLNSEEFKWQMMRLLLKLPGIGNIKSRTGYLESTLQGRKIAIGYHNANFDEELSPQLLASFLHTIRMEGYKEVIFVTSGSYNEQCKTLAEKKSTVKVHLFDKTDLLNIMEKSNMFPEDQVIDSLIYKEISKQQRSYMIFKKEILTPKRIRTYLGYFVFFMVLSGIFRTFAVYYMFISAIFLALALVAYFWGGKNTLQPDDTSVVSEELTQSVRN